MSTTQLTSATPSLETYPESNVFSFLSIFAGIFLFYILASSLLSITSSSLAMTPWQNNTSGGSSGRGWGYRKYYNINGTKYYYCPYRKRMIKV